MVTQDDIMVKVKGMLSAVGFSGIINPFMILPEMLIHLDQLLKMVLEYEGLQMEDASDLIVKWLVDDRIYQIRQQARDGELDRKSLQKMVDSIKENLSLVVRGELEEVFQFVEEAEEILNQNADAFEDFVNGLFDEEES